MANVNTLPSVSSLSSMGILNNEILTCTNLYHESGPYYFSFIGKSSSQELHAWNHGSGSNKWVYHKDSTNGWWYLTTSLFKKPPANEKIVSWNRTWSPTIEYQLWAY